MAETRLQSPSVLSSAQNRAFSLRSSSSHSLSKSIRINKKTTDSKHQKSPTTRLPSMMKNSSNFNGRRRAGISMSTNAKDLKVFCDETEKVEKKTEGGINHTKRAKNDNRTDERITFKSQGSLFNIQDKENLVPEFESMLISNHQPCRKSRLNNESRLILNDIKNPKENQKLNGVECIERWKGKIPFSLCSPDSKQATQNKKRSGLRSTQEENNHEQLNVYRLAEKLEALDTVIKSKEEELAILDPLPIDALCPGAPRMPSTTSMPLFDDGEDSDVISIYDHEMYQSSHQFCPLAEVTEAYTGLPGGWGSPEIKNKVFNDDQIGALKIRFDSRSSSSSCSVDSVKQLKSSKITFNLEIPSSTPQTSNNIQTSNESKITMRI